jgi:uncharacterized protein YjbI with pentapeptide repeats
MSTNKKLAPDSIVREIKRKTRRKYSAEGKVRIVMDKLRSELGVIDNANLQGADLMGANGLFQKQLAKVKTLYNAKLENYLFNS